MDREGIILSAETSFLDITGYDAHEILRRNLKDFVPEHLHFLLNNGFKGLAESDDLLKINGIHKKDFEIPLQFTVKEDPGEPQTFFINIKDVSYRKEIENQLLTSRENYQILAETATDAIVQINSDFNITFANSAVQRVFGYDSLEIENNNVGILFPRSRYSKYEKQFEKYFYIDDTHRADTGLKNSLEVLGRNKNGDLIPLEISFGNSKGSQNTRRLTCIIRDIASRKKSERRLKYLAYHDKLTTLGNRDRLVESLDQLLAEIERQPDRKGALLFLDLDGFKKVNDSLGHEMGDAILKECAKRLMNSLRKNDQVYRIQVEDIFRLGGDEFTLLLPYINKIEDAAIVARRIISRILEPFNIDGYGSITHINMGVSIGIVMIPQDGKDRTTLLRNADSAMYKAKELGNKYVFFTNDMNNMAIERLMLEEGLRKSLGTKNFSVYYQPILNAEREILGVEALIRWFHDKEGMIPPKKFISIAEDTGLILPIGRWVLETACRHLKIWQDSGFGHLHLAVNISARQLEQGDLGNVIQEVVKKLGVNSGKLKLELTETCVMNNPESAIDKMNDITSSNPGIKIAIDDFGTGYSSFGYLSRFPVNDLKIDRSFVINLSRETNKKIINSIVTLGESLGLTVVAEGVETGEHFQYLKERNCNLFQGFYFSKPVPFEDMTELLEAGKL